MSSQERANYEGMNSRRATLGKPSLNFILDRHCAIELSSAGGVLKSVPSSMASARSHVTVKKIKGDECN